MEKMREDFEAWLCNEYEWGEGALASSEFQGDAVSGYYIGGGYIYDGSSCDECLFWAWRGWQASRAAIEITPPEIEKWRSVDAVRAQSAYRVLISKEIADAGLIVRCE